MLPRLDPGALRPLAVVAALLVAACAGSDAGSDRGGDRDDRPRRGGSVTYALEAETPGGWCLPEALLAVSGITVARAIYDTLTAPDADGSYVPYLARSVEPNDDFTEWTIGLRAGVKFHDGSPLTAQVVKNNLDAFRGKYPARSSLLFVFVLADVATVEVTGDLEVTVTTTRPWIAFPAFLYANGRLGISAQAQLDDPDTCDTKLIGTGPFKIESWKVNEEFLAEKNPDYWQEAPDGRRYPYLDEIRFRPIVEGEQRVNALQAGDVDLVHTSAAQDTLTLRELQRSGRVDLYASDTGAEVAYVLLNTSRKPLDDLDVRRAMALAVDPDQYSDIINQGLFTTATGPFAPGSIAHLSDTGYPPKTDVAAARDLIDDYERANGPIRITYFTIPESGGLQVAQFLQQKYRAVGIDMTLRTVEQSELITAAITGEYDAIDFRNHSGVDPDEQYSWWATGSPVNFGRIADPTLQRLLATGRSETDPARRRTIYQDVNRRFARQFYNLWAYWLEWTVAGRPAVHGFDVREQPDLPGGAAPFPGLADGHPTLGLWTRDP